MSAYYQAVADLSDARAAYAAAMARYVVARLDEGEEPETVSLLVSASETHDLKRATDDALKEALVGWRRR
jgi:hypothetical protein